MKLIIIDANTWASVFSTLSSDHAQFQKVRDGIVLKKLTLAWGGSIYRSELQRCIKYLNLHNELTKGSRAKQFLDTDVDTRAVIVSAAESDPDFDDAHIIALQIVSKAPVICTKDARAHKFIKKAVLYPKKHKRPSIYSNSTHVKLL
jgi:predicted nucleic acid-binding protein